MPPYFHGFLANFIVFANIQLFFEKCSLTQSANSAENFNISVTELWVRGTPKIFRGSENFGVPDRNVEVFRRERGLSLKF